MGLFSRGKRPDDREKTESGGWGSGPAASAPMVDPAGHDPAARWLREALLRRDWRSARDFLVTVSDPDDRAFYLTVCADVEGVQDWIGEWIAAEPGTVLPVLVRGAHAVHWAWEARGMARASDTSMDQFHGFHQRLRLAEQCLGEVVQRDHGETAAWTFLLRSARGLQVGRAELLRRWGHVAGRHPHHWPAHAQMLLSLTAKWSGSDEDMFAFAREAAAKSPAGGPLAGLVANAHIEKWMWLDEAGPAYITRQDVRNELLAAARHSVLHPAYRDRPAWLAVPNAFAFALAVSGQAEAALRVFDMIGHRVTEYPWTYYHGDGATAFVELREYALKMLG
jgi:hypothetical protein